MVFIFSLPNCKKNEVIRIGYVTGDHLIVYSKPSRFSPPLTSLQRNSEFQIVESDVLDIGTDNLPKFHKVQFEKTSGFVSYHDEKITKSFASFLEKETIREGFVYASNLRLRKNPSLTADVIKLLPNGTKVTVLSRSTILETIDNIEDHWVKIKTSDGTVGFSFAGYIKIKTDNEKLSEFETSKVLGYIKIIADPPKYYSYSSRDSDLASENDPAPCGGKNEIRFLPKTNEFVLVKEKSNDSDFYHITRMFNGGNECSGGYTAWISSKDVEFIPNVFANTIPSVKDDVNREILKVANDRVGGNLNANLSTIQPIGTSKNNQEPLFYLVRAYIGGGQEHNFNVVLKKSGSTFNAIGSYLIAAGWGENKLEFQDFDGDGTPEIISNIAGRSTSEYEIYRILPTGTKLLFQFGTSDYQEPQLYKVEFKPPYIIKTYRDEATEEQLKFPKGLQLEKNPDYNVTYVITKRLLKFQNGTFEEVGQ